jgi:hypothetical protein
MRSMRGAICDYGFVRSVVLPNMAKFSVDPYPCSIFLPAAVCFNRVSPVFRIALILQIRGFAKIGDRVIIAIAVNMIQHMTGPLAMDVKPCKSMRPIRPTRHFNSAVSEWCNGAGNHAGLSSTPCGTQPPKMACVWVVTQFRRKNFTGQFDFNGHVKALTRRSRKDGRSENESCRPDAIPASPMRSFDRRGALAWGPIGALLLSARLQELELLTATATGRSDKSGAVAVSAAIAGASADLELLPAAPLGELGAGDAAGTTPREDAIGVTELNGLKLLTGAPSPASDTCRAQTRAGFEEKSRS